MFAQEEKDTTSRLEENMYGFTYTGGTWGKFVWHVCTVKVYSQRMAKHIFRVFVRVRHVYNGGNLCGMYVHQIE